jgi:uncharacterized protein YndB with AHSA1/START domain
MYYIFLILAVIVAFVALIFLVALFSKKEYAISRTIVIDKPVAEVFDYLKHIVNQEQFSKWVMTDPTMAKNLIGKDGEVGFIYQWNSQNKHAGEGEQEIIAIQQNELLKIEVRFKRPFKGVAQTPFTTESIQGNSTKVTWGMSSKMNYPMNAMLLFVNIDKMLGKNMEISLSNLKTILESNSTDA